MKAPVLNRKFALEAADRQPDGQGGHEESWGTLGTLWGELKGMTGSDRLRGEAAMSLATFRITVRAAPPNAPSRPVAGQRLREGPRLFSILAVVDRDVEGRWLTCFCREETVR
ncbi:MAG: head-tail adaptor protein [Paracoccaceae bacterium]|nr:head-tail adaptor protein [Paracoccaceae bacterium]